LFFGWPGLGDQPHEPGVEGIDDLIRLVENKIDSPVDLVAQSMGGVIAASIAITRPEIVRRLVLTVTSGGVDISAFHPADWRPDYRNLFPRAADWITRREASPNLPVERISAPTLLIWGEADEISPVAVGRNLESRIVNARLHVVPNGKHDLASELPDLVASLIATHLR
jgi:pimeloyl-ACP methyl ester carboxylesterase